MGTEYDAAVIQEMTELLFRCWEQLEGTDDKELWHEVQTALYSQGRIDSRPT